MKQRLALVSIVVAAYDEAIAWYTQKLGFTVVEDRPDTRQGPGRRWVVVVPPGGGDGTALLLARASNEQQRAAIGNQTGGRVFLFLHTDDFARDYAAYRERGVTFVRGPSEESYGQVAVFTDLYGNRWDLIEPTDGKSSG
jgi:catechol 2,3-dioxygenase-like lactoylglutathione lyase family enzyme